jgi:hypothetical protein
MENSLHIVGGYSIVSDDSIPVGYYFHKGKDIILVNPKTYQRIIACHNNLQLSEITSALISLNGNKPKM